jgi:hypothetical protein
MTKTNYIEKNIDSLGISKIDALNGYTGFLDRLYKKGKGVTAGTIFTIALALTGIHCSAEYKHIRDPKDKRFLTETISINSNTDQRFKRTKITHPDGRVEETEEVINDSSKQPVYSPGWGWGYPLLDGRYYSPPTSTAPYWPSWNFWGPGLNGGTLYRLNELEEELRPDTEEGPFISGLESLTPEQYMTALGLFKKHRMETRLDSES